MFPPDSLQAFLSILFEGAPFLLLGTVLAGFVDIFLPADGVVRMLPKNRLLATIGAGLLGLILPVSVCTMVPVARRLIRKGLPASCAVTYLLAAPILNPAALLSTWTAFYLPVKGDTGHLVMTVGRVSLGFGIAVLVGLFLLRKKPEDLFQKSVTDTIGTPGGSRTEGLGFDTKLVLAMRSAMRDFLETAMYFTIGVAIVSLFNTQVSAAKVQSLTNNPQAATPVLMALSYVLALCSSSDAFVIAPLKGFSHGAKLAFLVFGPMLDIKLTFVYVSLFRKSFLTVLALALLLFVGLLSGPWVGVLEKVFSH